MDNLVCEMYVNTVTIHDCKLLLKKVFLIIHMEPGNARDETWTAHLLDKSWCKINRSLRKNKNIIKA